ncbi:MAG TPA: class I tRNA ligase family protein, partial [Alphaproteobacteria bacterium]|nr:class I tRNA ligase family protein [Alphaproteobacteria bacterium]
IGKDSIKSTADLYRRIRNTLRFLLGALDGFTKDEAVSLADPKALPELEQLVLHQLADMDKKVRSYIQNYEFLKLTKELHDFCNENLSAFYFDIRKDSLYCDDPANPKRRACRSVMAEIFSCLTAWLAPVLAFTAEEAWSMRPAGVFEDAESVHLREFPAVPASYANAALAEKWVKIAAIREAVTKAVEPLRVVKRVASSLEAAPTISVDDMKVLDGLDLAEICITAPVRILSGAPGVSIEKAAGDKCERCWKVLEEVSEGLCTRCNDAVKQVKKAA